MAIPIKTQNSNKMKTTPQVSLIVAALQPNLGIGAKGKLPWRLKQEIQYFRDVTAKSRENHVNAVVMGRKTWESIPARFRPLPGRLNVVLSRAHENTSKDGVLFYKSMDSVLQMLQRPDFLHENNRIDKIFVIGGAQVYNALLSDPRVDNLLITDLSYVGDAQSAPELDAFLDWDLTAWEKKSVEDLQEFVDVEFQKGVVAEGNYNYEYTMWERKR